MSLQIRVSMKETRNEVKPKEACMAYVGIDVSKDTLAIDAGDLYTGTIRNNKSALGKAVRAIRKAAGGRDARITYVAEHTGCYSLLVHLELAKAGEAVSMVDPKRVRHFAKVMSVAAKSDPLDAAVIRKFAEFAKPEPTPLPSENLVESRETIRSRGLLMKVRVMLGALAGVTISATCKTALKAVIAAIDRQVDNLDGRLLELFEHADATTRRKVVEMEKIRGVGRLTAFSIATAVPEIGTLGPQRAASISGLAPFVRQSGKWKGHQKISAGRSEVRRALYMPAVCAIVHNEVLRKVYRHLIVDLHKPKKVAITAVMRKLIIHMDRVCAALPDAGATVVGE